jgi:hypothetical protein
LALHFTGHGTEEKELMLEHTYGEAEYVSEEQLKKILESSKSSKSNADSVNVINSSGFSIKILK